MEIITRAEAVKRGLKFYTIEKPCPKGHVGPRYTNSCACLQCAQESEPAAYQKRKAREKAKRQRRRGPVVGNRVAVISQVNIPQF